MPFYSILVGGVPWDFFYVQNVPGLKALIYAIYTLYYVRKRRTNEVNCGRIVMYSCHIRRQYITWVTWWLSSLSIGWLTEYVGWKVNKWRRLDVVSRKVAPSNE